MERTHSDWCSIRKRDAQLRKRSLSGGEVNGISHPAVAPSRLIHMHQTAWSMTASPAFTGLGLYLQLGALTSGL